MIKRIKKMYWSWVVSCCETDIREINDCMGWLSPIARIRALNELLETQRDLRRARHQLIKLGK